MAEIIYTIQTPLGQVWGPWKVPPTTHSAEVIAEELRRELPEDIIGPNGIHDDMLVVDSDSGEAIPRVVVDLWPRDQEELTRNMVLIHQAIGKAALTDTE